MSMKTRHWALPAFFFAALAAAACGTANDTLPSNQDCPTPTGPTTTATTGGDTTVTATSTGSGETTTTTGTGGSTASGTGGGTPEPNPEPPSAQEIFARLHGCNKIRYLTLGTMLSARGATIPINIARSSGVPCQTDNRDCTSNSQCASGLSCITNATLGISGKCGKLSNVNGVGQVFFPDPAHNCQEPNEACYCPNGTCSGGMFGPSSNGNTFLMNPTGICLKDDNNDDQITEMDAVFAELQSFGGSRNVCQNDDNGNVREFASGSIQGCNAGERCYCPSGPCVSNVSTSSGNNNGKTGFCVPKVSNGAVLYTSARDALAVPGFDSRKSERDGHTTASALRLFDIFVMSAESIIANISDPAKAPACTRNNNNPDMFAADGSCSEEAVSCLIGYPATDDHMLLCNLIVNKADKNDASDVNRKRHIAIATLLSAAHSCE